MVPIILLSGPVGAGKTTVAKHLVQTSPGPVACIEGDKFWPFIVKSDGRPANKNFRTIMAAMMAATIPFANADYEVILDFSIPPWFLETAKAIVKRREIPLDYVVLRPSLAVCAARAAARTEGTVADYTQYKEFYDDFGKAERYTVKDDESSPEKLAAIIRGGLNMGRFRLPE